MTFPLRRTRAALVVAHPSHELRLYGWLRAARPRVFVLTDGAGRTGHSRLEETSRLIERAGAAPGDFYGRYTDLEVYASILEGRGAALFSALAEELAEALARERIDYVVGDRAEGYNTVHDACRLLVDAAVELARRRHGRVVRNFDYAVVGPPDELPTGTRAGDFRLRLDAETFADKLAAACAYCPRLAADVAAAAGGASFEGIKHFSEPQEAGAPDPVLGAALDEALSGRPELRERLRPAFEGVALEDLRVESLRPVRRTFEPAGADGLPPFYELYGETLVAAGRYRRAIRYREHMLPLAEGLRGLAESEVRWASSAC